MEIWVIVTAISGLLLAILIGYLVSSHSKRVREVALLGLSGSGKTRLFYKITSSKTIASVTSQVRNEFVLTIGKKLVHLTDMPGHPRVKTEAMGVAKSSDIILFAIDSETILDGSIPNSIGNFMYDILSLERIIKKKIPLCVVCTKSDVPGARPIELIQSELEREFEQIRSNRLQSTYVEGEEHQQLFLGDEDSFSFSQLSSPVEFVASSADNIEEVMNYLERTL